MEPRSYGDKTPKSLFNAVFVMNGNILCLRGGREHKDLKVAQLTFGEDSGGEFVVYTENGSKNRSGLYKNAGDNKIVKQYAVSELGEKCYVYLLKLYYSKLPAKLLKDPESVFYWKPKDKVPMATDAPWFVLTPVGHNPLASNGEEHVSGNWSNRKDQPQPQSYWGEQDVRN